MDLSTTYLGIKLRTPIIPASSPLAEEIDNICMMEDAGAAAVILPSLFEEQLLSESNSLHHHLSYGTDLLPESLSYLPDPADIHLRPEEYLRLIQQAKVTVDIPVIASLNGDTDGGWVNYARQIENAGADALELNIYAIQTNVNLSGEEVEAEYLNIVKSVRSCTSLPLAVKLTPFFTNLSNMAKRIVEAGADALVLFNRFQQPDIDLKNHSLYPHYLPSRPFENRLPLTWIGILYKKLDVDFAAVGGLETAEDVLKMLMVGANVTMMASAIYKNGIHHIRTVEQDLARWMEENEYSSIDQMQGSMSQLNCEDPSAFERTQYIRTATTRLPVRP